MVSLQWLEPVMLVVHKDQPLSTNGFLNVTSTPVRIITHYHVIIVYDFVTLLLPFPYTKEYRYTYRFFAYTQVKWQQSTPLPSLPIYQDSFSGNNQNAPALCELQKLKKHHVLSLAQHIRAKSGIILSWWYFPEGTKKQGSKYLARKPGQLSDRR